MGWGQNVRARLLGPLLRLLIRCRVSPDQITLLSLVAGVAFAPLLFWNRAAAIVALVLHVVLDGIDGPLARQLGTNSRQGSFTDSTSDQIVVAATTLALISIKTVDSVTGGVYIFVYTLVVAFAMVRNALGVPYLWLVRPRFVVYACAALELSGYAPIGMLNVVLWVCNAALGIKMATGFYFIRRSL